MVHLKFCFFLLFRVKGGWGVSDRANCYQISLPEPKKTPSEFNWDIKHCKDCAVSSSILGSLCPFFKIVIIERPSSILKLFYGWLSDFPPLAFSPCLLIWQQSLLPWRNNFEIYFFCSIFVIKTCIPFFFASSLYLHKFPQFCTNGAALVLAHISLVAFTFSGGPIILTPI